MPIVRPGAPGLEMARSLLAPSPALDDQGRHEGGGGDRGHRRPGSPASARTPVHRHRRLRAGPGRPTPVTRSAERRPSTAGASSLSGQSARSTAAAGRGEPSRSREPRTTARLRPRPAHLSADRALATGACAAESSAPGRRPEPRGPVEAAAAAAGQRDRERRPPSSYEPSGASLRLATSWRARGSAATRTVGRARHLRPSRAAAGGARRCWTRRSARLPVAPAAGATATATTAAAEGGPGGCQARLQTRPVPGWRSSCFLRPSRLLLSDPRRRRRLGGRSAPSVRAWAGEGSVGGTDGKTRASERPLQGKVENSRARRTKRVGQRLRSSGRV
jgi:hypothetical protein